MSRHEKSVQKLRAKPPPADFKWNELKALLERLGYEMLSSSGSRRKFVHRESSALISCHEPHPSPNVDKGCIAAVVEHLERLGRI